VTIKSLLFVLFLCVCLVWVGAAYFYSGPEFQRFGLLWTAVVLIAALALIAGARLFGWWRLWRAKAASRPAVPAKAAPPVHADDAALAALIAEANAALAKAPGYGGSGYAGSGYAGSHGKSPLSRLPLYLLIGPEGAGKTSTFLNSGVEPQLLAGEASGKAPVAPTRLCNLWLAKNAVFIEFSGRAFSGEPGRWGQLLGVLRGRAPVPLWRRFWREPDEGLTLRGVIGFCDMKELTGASADPQRLERDCREWQERLRAVAEVFGVEYPVYQVFTKCDKIPFFPDFFGRLPESDANQVLGCTLPIRKLETLRPGEVFAEVQAKRLTGSFRPLYQSLAERRLAHLAHEPNPARRPGIYEFPRELKRIRSPLVQFLTDVFRPHPLRPGPLLRGYYLTAVREVEAAAADPAVSRADWTSPNLGMETTRLFRGDATQIFNPDDGSKSPNPIARKGMGLRWMFVSDLFHQVVLADQPVQRTAPVDARLERYRRGVFAGVCGLCVLLCLAFAVSWARNRQLLQDVADAGSADIQKRGNLVTLPELRALERLRLQVDRLQEGDSLSFHWGLYQGKAILDTARNAYFRRFRQLLLNDLNGVMLGQLQKLPAAPGAADPEEPAYGLLKTHLTISSGVCKPEPVLVSRVLKSARSQLAADADPEWQSLADKQIAFYVSALGDGNPCRLTEDAEVRDHARQYLQKIKGVDRIYRRILTDAEKTFTKPQRLDDLAPNYKQVLNGQAEVSAAFTHEGWQFVQKASKEGTGGSAGESCVTGNSGGLVSGLKQDAGVERAIQELFIHDYIEQWQKFVAAFSVIPYKGAADAAQKLEILAGNKSPLLALLAMTAAQTDFSITTEPGVVAKAEKAIGDLVKKGEKTATKFTEAGKVTHGMSSTADITQSFQPVHCVVPAASERWITDKNGAYMDALAGLRSAVQAIARASGDTPDPQTLQAAVQSAVDKAEDSVRQLAKSFNPEGVGILDGEVTRLLNEPIKNAKLCCLSPPKPKADPELQRFCSPLRTLLRKYPFTPSSVPELPLKDLADYFAPDQGRIWKFQSSALAEFTILDGGVWKQNPASQKLKASPELLDFLNRAQGITKAFFPDGGTNPHLSYTLRPHLANADQLISLRIDGQPHEFSQNSVIQKSFGWPAAPGLKPEAVGRSGTRGFSNGFSSHEGVWSVFQMFGDAEPRSLREPTLEWKRSKGPSGRLEPIEPAVKLEFVGFPGGADIFNPKFFEGLQCPSKAVQ